MVETQVTLFQLDNYGPWTVTPEPRREADLQTLQARIFADCSQFVGSRGGYVFFTRFDNVLAVTNGLTMADHEHLLESVANGYPVTMSAGVGHDPSPVAAVSEATERLQTAGSAQDRSREMVCDGETIAPGDRADDDVHVAHFDVVDVTGSVTDRVNAYDAFVEVETAYGALLRYMRERHEALSFFVGGDNVIVVCPDLAASDYHEAVDYMESTVDVGMQVGVGTGRSAHEAGMAAKYALEECRYGDSRVEVFRDGIPE